MKRRIISNNKKQTIIVNKLLRVINKGKLNGPKITTTII